MLKVLSLFSGIGAFEKALERLKIDYELVNYCEIDKYASKSYSIIHNVSEDKNLWDVTKVDTDKLPKDIDLLTHGSPCFTGDTLILTKDGYKQIKDITIGDYVLDHTNSYNEVINFFNQCFRKGIILIWQINMSLNLCLKRFHCTFINSCLGILFRICENFSFFKFKLT